MHRGVASVLFDYHRRFLVADIGLFVFVNSHVVREYHHLFRAKNCTGAGGSHTVDSAGTSNETSRQADATPSLIAIRVCRPRRSYPKLLEGIRPDNYGPGHERDRLSTRSGTRSGYWVQVLWAVPRPGPWITEALGPCSQGRRRGSYLLLPPLRRVRAIPSKGIVRWGAFIVRRDPSTLRSTFFSPPLSFTAQLTTLVINNGPNREFTCRWLAGFWTCTASR